MMYLVSGNIRVNFGIILVNMVVSLGVIVENPVSWNVFTPLTEGLRSKYPKSSADVVNLLRLLRCKDIPG